MSQQHPWGAPRHNQSTRLTPISTSAAHEQRNTPSPSGSRQPYSPAASSFPSLPSAQSRLVSSRKSSAASSTSSAPFAAAGQQLPASQLLSSRSRTNTNQPSQLASSAAPGGASTNSSGGASKLVRASPSSSTVGSPSTATNPASGASSQNLSRIVIAQVFLLLSQFGPIKDEKDRSKWDTQTEQIRKVRHWSCLYTSPLCDTDSSLADRFKRHGGVLKILPARAAEQCSASLRHGRPQHRPQWQLSNSRDRGTKAAKRP